METKNAPKATGNQPLKKFRYGAVSTTIWKNEATTKEGKTFTNYSVVTERNYKDAKGEWQKTSSMRQNDLPKAILGQQKAFEFIAEGAKEDEE